MGTLAVPPLPALAAGAGNGPPALGPAGDKPGGEKGAPPLAHPGENRWGGSAAPHRMLAGGGEDGGVVVPALGVGEAVAAVGGGGGWLGMVTLAVPILAPLVAVTVKGPPELAPAVNRPEEEIVPPPLTDQVKIGWLASAAPN